MSKLLPKGHVSCLSSTFRYTPAMQTNVAQTFARIRRELAERSEVRGEKPADITRRRRFSVDAAEAALRFLRAGGLRAMPRLLASSDLSDA
jgi:hypothetical protein